MFRGRPACKDVHGGAGLGDLRSRQGTQRGRGERHDAHGPVDASGAIAHREACARTGSEDGGRVEPMHQPPWRLQSSEPHDEREKLIAKRRRKVEAHSAIGPVDGGECRRGHLESKARDLHHDLERRRQIEVIEGLGLLVTQTQPKTFRERRQGLLRGKILEECVKYGWVKRPCHGGDAGGEGGDMCPWGSPSSGGHAEQARRVTTQVRHVPAHATWWGAAMGDPPTAHDRSSRGVATTWVVVDTRTRRRFLLPIAARLRYGRGRRGCVAGGRHADAQRTASGRRCQTLVTRSSLFDLPVRSSPPDPEHAMKTPRLRGKALEAALAIVRSAPGRAIIRREVLRSYRLHELESLPLELRPPLVDSHAPHVARAPRRWHDQELGPLPSLRGVERGRDLRAAYDDGSTRPSHVLKRALERLDRGDLGHVHFSPFVVLDRERALRDAKASDARWERGEPLSPLDGVLVPVKDEHDFAGLPTRGGTAYLNEPAAEDSFVVRTLREAGAILYGKTHTTEWGMNPVGINPHFDMPRNVRNADRAAGGSSSGSGAAVALGLATVALGSDGGGSIRIPSSLQGVRGIKPTFQRLGRTGDVYGRGSVAACGPIAQSTADLADFLGVASRPDPGDWASRLQPVDGFAESLEAALGRGVRGARIGIPRREWDDADPRVAALCLDALEALEQEGAVLVDVEIPGIEYAQAAGVLSIGPETFANLTDDRVRHADRMSLELHVLLEILGSLQAREYLLGQRVRNGIRHAMVRAFHDLDLLALPTLPEVARRYPVDENRMQVQDDVGTQRMCRYAFLANITGWPAGSVPVGLHEGLAVGLQFIGDAWDEASVLAAMAHLERIGLGALDPPRAWATLR